MKFFPRCNKLVCLSLSFSCPYRYSEVPSALPLLLQVLRLTQKSRLVAIRMHDTQNNGTEQNRLNCDAFLIFLIVIHCIIMLGVIYVECHSVECHYVKCQSVSCFCDECHFAESHIVEYQYEKIMKLLKHYCKLHNQITFLQPR
jgi:hypothetical protein